VIGVDIPDTAGAVSVLFVRKVFCWLAVVFLQGEHSGQKKAMVAPGGAME
jgi:hypothetical protein